MRTGREEEYKEDYISKVDEYLSNNIDEFFEFHKTRGDKSDSYDRKIKVNLPTIEGFALFIDVSKKSLYNWEKKYPDFLHALDKIRAEQKKRLIDSGLSGDYNPTIAKLVLSANHGMVERTDVTTADEKINPIIVKFIDGEQQDNTNTE